MRFSPQAILAFLGSISSWEGLTGFLGIHQKGYSLAPAARRKQNGPNLCPNYPIFASFLEVLSNGIGEGPFGWYLGHISDVPILYITRIWTIRVLGYAHVVHHTTTPTTTYTLDVYTGVGVYVMGYEGAHKMVLGE